MTTSVNAVCHVLLEPFSRPQLEVCQLPLKVTGIVDWLLPISRVRICQSASIEVVWLVKITANFQHRFKAVVYYRPRLVSLPYEGLGNFY